MRISGVSKEALKFQFNEAFGELMKYCREVDFDESIIQELMDTLNFIFLNNKPPMIVSLPPQRRYCSVCSYVTIGKFKWERGIRICADCRWKTPKEKVS